jgi:mono/diheme cytochrome c family protein
MFSRYYVVVWIAVLALIQGCSACTEQHRPEKHWNTADAERILARNSNPNLADDGSLPVSGAEEVVDAPGTYKLYCASCHGDAGKGDGAGGVALNPKPRNLTDAAWQDSVDDARIAKVIKEGGTSVGLSATMAPWGSVISEKGVQALVAHIRGLKGT